MDYYQKNHTCHPCTSLCNNICGPENPDTQFDYEESVRKILNQYNVKKVCKYKHVNKTDFNLVTGKKSVYLAQKLHLNLQSQVKNLTWIFYDFCGCRKSIRSNVLTILWFTALFFLGLILLIWSIKYLNLKSVKQRRESCLVKNDDITKV